MGEPIKMRIREGCRGGSEQFTWNSLKEQEFKDREQYLGGSTKVGLMGKFGRYYQHDWYSKKRDTAASIDDEKTAVKAYEDELMQEALGLKPKKLLLAKKQLSEEELKEFLKKDNEKNGDKKGREQMGPQAKIVRDELGNEMASSNEAFIAEAARDAPIKGLGFAIHRTAKLEEIKAKTLGTEGELKGSTNMSGASSLVAVKEKYCQKSETKDEEEANNPGSSSSARPVGLVDDAQAERLEAKLEAKHEMPDSVRGNKEKRSKSERKAAKKEAKHKKKQEKKQKKREKKEKKALKRARKASKEEQRNSKAKRRKSTSSSSSDSSSSSSS